jgi:ABC-type transport system involved in multi-copper enzyme maturation permease subunit
MASRAIKPKREPAPQPSGWQGLTERAPSLIRDDAPALPRYVAIFSLMLITLGGAALLFRAWDRPYLIPSGIGFLLFIAGIGGLQYHAYYEKDFQFRRIYGFLGGFGLFAVALILRLAPLGASKAVGGAFLPYGALCGLLALGFLISFVRNEADATIRTYALYLIGLSALANGVAGFIGGMVSENFLLQTGILHLVFGLLYAVGYVSLEGIATPRGLLAGRGLGIFGGALFLVALGRSLLPWLLYRYGWRTQPPSAFFLPSGLLLMYLGAEYLILFLGICSDNKLVVMTRRELASFFCSPIAYIVLIGMASMGWLSYGWFLNRLTAFSEPSMRGGGSGMPEPIVYGFLVNFPALIPTMFLVPIITMRMVSEEKRTGTLEVLLTAPVNEWQVVLSKFLAALRVFLVCFAVWGIYLLALRIETGQEFDYRPIITFLIALTCMGAGFMAMGVFFSSVTRHQILAAVLTFMVMFVLTLLYILVQDVQQEWLSTLVSYISYLDLWISSARGVITPRLLVLNASVAVLWLYLSVKVLEARKWS